MPTFGFDSKGIIDAINKAAKDIKDGLKEVIGGKVGKAGIPFRGPTFDVKGAEGGALSAIIGIKAGEMMAETVNEVNKHFSQITEKFQDVGKVIGTILFNPLEGIAKVTGKLMKKTFSGPKAKAMGGFMRNIGSMMGTMLGPIGFILSIFEKLGVFEPILEIVNDLIEMLGAKMLEKLMPSFEQLFDIMLSDEVMTLIDSLANLFVAMLEPIMELVITLLPVFVAILGPLIGLLAALMPLLMLPAMIIAKLIGTLVELPAFTIAIEAISGAITLAATAIGGFVDFVITVINDFMNLITAGLWKDIPTMGGETGGTTTAAGGPATAPAPAIGKIGEGSGGTSINITVEGDVTGEETIDKLIDEIALRTKLGGFM